MKNDILVFGICMLVVTIISALYSHVPHSDAWMAPIAIAMVCSLSMLAIIAVLTLVKMVTLLFALAFGGANLREDGTTLVEYLALSLCSAEFGGALGTTPGFFLAIFAIITCFVVWFCYQMETAI